MTKERALAAGCVALFFGGFFFRILWAALVVIVGIWLLYQIFWVQNHPEEAKKMSVYLK